MIVPLPPLLHGGFLATSIAIETTVGFMSSKEQLLWSCKSLFHEVMGSGSDESAEDYDGLVTRGTRRLRLLKSSDHNSVGLNHSCVSFCLSLLVTRKYRVFLAMLTTCFGSNPIICSCHPPLSNCALIHNLFRLSCSPTPPSTKVPGLLGSSLELA